MKAKLNGRIGYENGYITPMMIGQAREPAKTKVDDAELVERVVGWGKSNAVVRWDAEDGAGAHYYLATV